jgi:hypothetical protein
MVVTRAYIVNDWRKTRCPVDCDEAVPFGPACPHQSWFPLPHRVEVELDDGNREVRAKCSEGRKPGGPRCRGWDEDKEDPCPHVKAVRDLLAGTAEDRDKGRAELVSISRSVSPRPRCPNCKEKWGVFMADDAARGRWRQARKKALKKKLVQEPETMWMCRHPNCADDAGRSWPFEEGTEDRPKSRRHEVRIREGFGWG